MLTPPALPLAAALPSLVCPCPHPSSLAVATTADPPCRLSLLSDLLHCRCSSLTAAAPCDPPLSSLPSPHPSSSIDVPYILFATPFFGESVPVPIVSVPVAAPFSVPVFSHRCALRHLHAHLLPSMCHAPSPCSYPSSSPVGAPVVFAHHSSVRLSELPRPWPVASSVATMPRIVLSRRCACPSSCARTHDLHPRLLRPCPTALRRSLFYNPASYTNPSVLALCSKATGCRISMTEGERLQVLFMAEL